MVPLLFGALTSCGSDDDDANFSIVGTWQTTFIDDEENETFTFTFNADGTGTEIMTYLEKGQTYTVKTEFTYTYDETTNYFTIKYENGSSASGTISVISSSQITVNGMTLTKV